MTDQDHGVYRDLVSRICSLRLLIYGFQPRTDEEWERACALQVNSRMTVEVEQLRESEGKLVHLLLPRICAAAEGVGLPSSDKDDLKQLIAVWTLRTSVPTFDSERNVHFLSYVRRGWRMHGGPIKDFLKARKAAAAGSMDAKIRDDPDEPDKEINRYTFTPESQRWKPYSTDDSTRRNARAVHGMSASDFVVGDGDAVGMNDWLSAIVEATGQSRQRSTELLCSLLVPGKNTKTDECMRWDAMQLAVAITVPPIHHTNELDRWVMWSDCLLEAPCSASAAP